VRRTSKWFNGFAATGALPSSVALCAASSPKFARSRCRACSSRA